MSAVISEACLASERSREIRARHARTIAGFLRVDMHRLLVGRPLHRARIIETYCALPENQPTSMSAAAFDLLEQRAASFERFCRRNQQWVRNELERHK